MPTILYFTSICFIFCWVYLQDPKEILEKVSRKLPVFTQTVSGGKKDILFYSLILLNVWLSEWKKVLHTATAHLSAHSLKFEV